MARKTMFILSIVILVLTFVWSCSDRESVFDTSDITTGGISPKNHVFVDELLMQLRNQFQLIRIMIYVPRASFPAYYGGSGATEVPLLLLLPPHDEDADFYLNHGLKDLADEMISTGEIEPMYIATIPSDPAKAFGGYFYANSSYPAGDYDALIGSTLVDYISKTWEHPTADPSQRGIGGVGTGAYGAFRAALTSPGTYSSISVADGPLDFDGAPGHGYGLEDLMLYVVQQEQTDLVTDSLFRADFDSSSSYPVSRMFIGGAMAFSPHDTLLDYEVRPHTNASGYSELLIIIDTVTRGKPGYAILDNHTFIEHLVMEDVRNFDFHLPFDHTGQPYQPIWDLWLDDNLENIGTGNELDGVAMWIATSPETQYGFHDQTMSWVETLEGRGYTPTVREYTGYGGNPATSHEYIYELLREILKFHSDNFKANASGN
ncbi:MAG: hypothetical protein KAW46_01025 [candidate division Zixibacteria bacterium]|nr:hypothetical protein [candidate division Zixibacteria bacterium]